MHVVLIETSGNQRYIFATNKLRENVGASELTYRVCTEWTLNAILDFGPTLWDESANELRKNLLRQPAIETNSNSVEVIVATSGKAILLVDDRETGKAIVKNVTSRALKQAPGLDVCGFISRDFDLSEEPLGQLVQEAHEQLEKMRDLRPGVALRSLRLPVVMDCATSGLPAAQWDIGREGGEGPTARSRNSLTKRAKVAPYEKRMATLIHQKDIARKFAGNIDRLDKYCDWLAVVHADGNGVGQILRSLWSLSGCDKRKEAGEPLRVINRAYLNLYRKFSIALDICTEEAFIKALKKLLTWKDGLRSLRNMKEKRDEMIPVLPIVLGGDDLTLVCDGQAGLQFTRDFLTEFENQTSDLETTDEELQRTLSGVIPPIANEAFTVPRLSACAGIAIVKPHYPFSAAYDLAEKLSRSAKSVKKKLQTAQNQPYPCSAMDFHTLYDASGSDLAHIRSKLRLPNEDAELFARPYVVTPQRLLAQLPPEKLPWTRRRDWQEFEKKIRAILAEEDGRRRLPNSQLHDLRAGLFLGTKAADGRYQLIRRRYLAQGIAEFDEATEFEETGESFSKSLFFTEENDEPGAPKQMKRTRLLDALDAANFWVKEDQQSHNNNSEDAQ